MKIADTKLKKAILIIIGLLFILVAVAILFASPIGKYLGKKYGEKYTGRQIKMGLVYVNPFTGFVHISDLVVYENKEFPGYQQGDSIFFSAKSVNANFAMLKFLSKTIEISEITLTNPRGIIIQENKTLNFSDWFTAFAPKHPHSAPSGIHFNILDIKIINGEFHYCEVVTPITYFLKAVNIESSGKRWNADTMAISFAFASGPGAGTAKGNITINFKRMDYRVAAVLEKYDLKFMEQYLKDLTNYGTFSANLDLDIKATGNFRDEEDINARGLVVLNEFHFGKHPGDDYAACEKLVLKIDELSPKNHKYNFDSLSLTHPYLKYERYDYLDNFQRMFGINGANISAANSESGRFNLIIEIAKYVKVLAKNFFQSDYKINKVAIYKGDFNFSDFSISEKFSAAINPLTFLADSINKNQKRVNATLRSGIQPFGYISANLSISPKNKEDFDLSCDIQKVPVAAFNPYLVTYTSFPLDRGTVEFHGIWNVRNGNIQSVNHLVIIDPRVTKRIRKKDAKWIPMPLIMSLVRERGNVIDYEIPITGDLKNPKFHLHDVLMDVLSNIFVKPATGPYRMEVRNMETEIEHSHSLKWKMRQNSLLNNQDEFITTMVGFLNDNPGASITVYPMTYNEKEKEYISFFEAKKKYYLLTAGKNAPFSESDSVKVDKMSVKDSLFVRSLNTTVNSSRMFTIQEKCSAYVGPEVIKSRLTRLNREREDAFLEQFRINGLQKRITVHPVENSIPYNGFSFYKITYKGDIPEALVNAYRKMNELNNEVPRKKFKKDRRQNRAALQGIK
jgi:hypothetical protein